MLFVFIVAIFIILMSHRAAVSRLGLERISRLEQTLQDFSFSLSGGEFLENSNPTDAPPSADDQTISREAQRILEAARRSGQEVKPTLVVAREILDAWRSFGQDANRWIHILSTRWILVHVITCLAGLWNGVSPLTLRSVPISGPVLILSALFLHWGLRRLPQAWGASLGHPTPNRRADPFLDWLDAACGNPNPGSWQVRLGNLAQKGRMRGVSIQNERLGLLREIARHELESCRRNLRRMEDLLPILELMGLGLPAAFCLFDFYGP